MSSPAGIAAGSEVGISDSHGEQVSTWDLRMALVALIGSRELESITVRQIRAELAVHLGLAADKLDLSPAAEQVKSILTEVVQAKQMELWRQQRQHFGHVEPRIKSWPEGYGVRPRPSTRCGRRL